MRLQFARSFRAPSTTATAAPTHSRIERIPTVINAATARIIASAAYRSAGASGHYLLGEFIAFLSFQGEPVRVETGSTLTTTGVATRHVYPSAMQRTEATRV